MNDLRNKEIYKIEKKKKIFADKYLAPGYNRTKDRSFFPVI